MFNREIMQSFFEMERVYLEGYDYNIKFKVESKGDKVFELERVGCNIFYKREVNIAVISGTHKTRESFDTYFGSLSDIEVVSGDIDKLMKDIEKAIKRVMMEKKLEK